MYIIQELDNGCWIDKYKSTDLDFISEMFHNFTLKYPEIKYRLLEMIIYV